MADISITAANVVSGDGAVKSAGIAGEAIAAGKAVYLSSTTKKWMLADSNSATAEARHSLGIALNGASLNQPVDVQKSGQITLAGMTANTPYFLSDTPGGICPIADVGAGEYLCQLGIALSATVLDINIQFTNVAN
jgi:hypothetical protein